MVSALTMGWPNHREMPVVERRDVRNAEAFCDGDHGSVRGSEREVAVLEDKISHPAVVMWGHVNNVEVPLSHGAKECCFDSRAGLATE